MPLSVLVPLVVVGIAGIAILLHLLGWSRRFDLARTGAVPREWIRHFPGDDVTGWRLAPDRGAALVLTRSGAGVLRAFGADTVAHRVRQVRAGAGGLIFDFGEFGAPPYAIRLPDEEAAAWRKAMEG